MSSKVIVAAKRGDDSAWRDLYAGIAPAVRAYFRARRTPDPDDLVGAVFLDVARSISSFEGDEQKFHAWVFTIAHRRWVDAVRAATRRPTSALSDSPEPVAVHDVESEAIASVGSEALLAVVDRLPPTQRSVVLLRVLGGLTHAEIATALDKTQVAVKVSYHRGIKALRADLATPIGPHHSTPLGTALGLDVTK